MKNISKSDVEALIKIDEDPKLSEVDRECIRILYLGLPDNFEPTSQEGVRAFEAYKRIKKEGVKVNT